MELLQIHLCYVMLKGRQMNSDKLIQLLKQIYLLSAISAMTL